MKAIVVADGHAYKVFYKNYELQSIYDGITAPVVLLSDVSVTLVGQQVMYRKKQHVTVQAEDEGLTVCGACAEPQKISDTRGYRSLHLMDGAVLLEHKQNSILRFHLLHTGTPTIDIPLSSNSVVKVFAGEPSSSRVLLRIASAAVQWLTVDIPQLVEALQRAPPSSSAPHKQLKCSTVSAATECHFAVPMLPYVLQGALTHGLPAELRDAVGDVQVWSAAFTTVASASVTQLQAASSTQRKSSKVGLAVVLTVEGELLCVANGRVLYQRMLPSAPAVRAGKDIHMQFTRSAQAPLLLVSCENTLLVLDTLQNGAVLKEFTHVGAYICAPLLHPMEEHIMVIPESEAVRLGITQVTHGHVLSDTSSPHEIGANDADRKGRKAARKAKEEAAQQPGLARQLELKNFFVYELPLGAGADVDIGRACRSMDPHCQWREDLAMTVDAELYNKVDLQWARIWEQNVAGAGGRGVKRSLDVAVETTKDVPPDASAAIRQRYESPAVQEPVAKERSTLVTQLGSRLQEAQAALRSQEASVRHKRASVNYLRSLVGTDAAAAGVRRVPTPSHVPRGGFAYFLETDQGSGDSPWLKELRDAERVVAKVEQSKETDGNAEAVDDEPMFPFLQLRGVSPVTLVVESLHYECVPHSTSVQIFALVCNRASGNTAFNAQLSAHCICADRLQQQRPCPLTTVSGRIDSLKPGKSVYVSALVRVPADEFVRSQREYVQFTVALVWREESGCGQAGMEEVQGTALPPVAVMNNVAATRAHSRTAGVVRVDIAEAYRCYQGVSATAQDTAAAQRRYWVSQCGAGAESGCLIARPGRPRLSASAATATRLHSFLPFLKVTVTSPLRGDVERCASGGLSVFCGGGSFLPRAVVEGMRAALRTAAGSVFHIDKIVEDLCAASASAGFRTSLLRVTGGGSGVCAGTSGLSNAATHLSLPRAAADCTDANCLEPVTTAELRQAFHLVVQRSGVLSVSPAAADPYTALGNALLELRRLLPQEVKLLSQAHSSAARCASLCLVEELKLLSLGYREQASAERKVPRHGSQDPSLLVRINGDLVVPAELGRRIFMARLITDLAVANFYC